MMRLSLILLPVTLLAGARVSWTARASGTPSEPGQVEVPYPGRGGPQASEGSQQPAAGELPPVTLEDLLREMRERNPSIRAARLVWEASRARPSQVGTLPDPVLTYGQRNEGFDRITLGESEMSAATLGASQEIPFPGKLGLRRREAEAMARRMEEMSRETELDVIAEVKEAFYDLFLIDRSLEILEKDKELLEKFERTAEARYEVGKGIQQDVLKAQVEISRFIEQIIRAEQERESRVANINRLLNRPPLAPLGRAAEFPRSPFRRSVEELADLALARSPAYRGAERDVERGQAGVSLARREYYPDFGLMGGWMNRGELTDMWEAQVGIRLPLYFWRKQRYGVREAESVLAAARESQEAAREAVVARVKDLYVVTTTADRLVDLYGTAIVPQARLSLESAAAGYEVGAVDFLTLLDNVITLLNYELEYYRQTVEYETALSRLEAVVGAPVTE